MTRCFYKRFIFRIGFVFFILYEIEERCSIVDSTHSALSPIMLECELRKSDFDFGYIIEFLI